MLVIQEGHLWWGQSCDAFQAFYSTLGSQAKVAAF